MKCTSSLGLNTSKLHHTGHNLTGHWKGSTTPFFRWCARQLPVKLNGINTYLPLFLFACREAPSSATGYSPFELLYGKHAHGPLDVLRHQWVPTMKKPRDATEWLLHLPDMLAEVRDAAMENQQMAKNYSKQYHDAKSKDRSFAIGDKVLVFSPVVTGRRADKLGDRWQGPYEILGRVTPVTYLVDMPERHK